MVHLIPSDVMFISLNSESNRNEVQASRRFQQMLTNFGVKTVNAFSIFNQIFEYNEKMSLQSLKARLAEKLDNYNYCVFITTKDLYQSFEKIGLSNICTSNVSMKDHEILHYILAEIIIKRIHGNAANHTISCHFIALDKTSIEYCGQIYSFIRPPVGKKYCISKESKFNMKHFKLLLNRLPSSFPNNEWTEEMNKFDPKSFLQILQRPNNLNPFHVQTRVSNQRKSDSDLTAPELSRLCSVPSTTRNMSDQDSNQTVLKSSICTSNTDGGTVPKMYGVATGLSSDANVTMVKITGGSEDDVTHAIKGKTSTEYSGVDATSTEIVDNDTINQTNVKDIMEFENDTTTPKSVLDSDVNISNIDISYLPVVTVTHIKTFKNATTSADESDYVIKNSEYNKAEKKSVTFNLVAKEETSTIILDTESRQRYTDKIESDGTKTSEDRETGCTPMVSYLSFMDETSVNTYHNIKVETESFSQSMIEMPSCHHIHGIGFQDTSQEVSGSSDEECLIWETSVNKNTQSISKGENEDILFKETCL